MGLQADERRQALTSEAELIAWDAQRRRSRRLARSIGHCGVGSKCCRRAGEYNGYGSGPLKFVCPSSCPCHD